MDGKSARAPTPAGNRLEPKGLRFDYVAIRHLFGYKPRVMVALMAQCISLPPA